MVVLRKKKNTRPRAIGLGVLVLCLWGDEQGTSVLFQQSLGFQPISQRPLRQHHYYIHPSQNGDKFPGSRSLSSSATSRDDFENADNKEKNSANNKSRVVPRRSHLTALCIVPPDEAWDTLQRARHFAGDQSYYEWPPALRLFHPFCESSKISDVALECARIVEEKKMKPFKITLNRWTVMPYPETLLSTTNHKNNYYDAKEEAGVVKPEDDDSYHPVDPRDEKVQALIAEEVRKGKIRKKIRNLKQQTKKQTEEFMKRKAFLELANNTQQLLAVESAILKNTALHQKEVDDAEEEEEEKAPVAEPLDTFNGRAMIALEPDEKSVKKLQKLRKIFQKELLSESDPSWGFSRPSDKEAGEKRIDGVWYDDNPSASGSFRPMIPIGAFTTFDAAISTAKKLKGLWDPLTFKVTDLHFISQEPLSQQNFESDYHNTNNIFQYDQQHADPLNQKTKIKNNNNSAGLPIMPSFQENRVHPAIRDSVSQFGLDALVMLMGEEIDMDDECNELMANLVWKDGIPGGADPAAAAAVDANDGENVDNMLDLLDLPQEDQEDFDDSRIAHNGEMERTLDLKDGDWAELMDWLDEEDEEEEEEIGTSVVIGRTHLFTGEKRKYPGMPASSTAEELYKAFGTGAIHSEESWDDVDFRLQA